MKWMLILAITAVLGAQCFGEIINIPEDFDTIQAGIDAAENDDVVLVQPGEYVETINFEGKAITVASLILTTGDRAYIDSTIINGDREDSVVRFENGEDDSSILQGFTVRNGFNISGGGINCGEASPTLLDLIISMNEARYDGGGVFVYGGSPRIMRSIIEENTGKGLQAERRVGEVEINPFLHDVIIRGNDRGGIFIGGVTVTLQNVLICNNTGRFAAGLYLGCSRGNLLTNVTIANNTTTRENRSGGLILGTWEGDAGHSEVTIQNCIIWGNSLPQIRLSHGEDERSVDFTASYCDIEGGEDGIMQSEFAEVVWGEGNIDEDPLFVDPDEGDYHLTEDSPCIDTGDPESDPDPDGTRADMGAFYYQAPSSNITFNRGWNLISINITPEEEFYREDEDRGPDIILMAQQLRVDDGNHHVQLMKDEDGRFYTPAQEFNNIPFWDLAEGYYVRVDENVESIWEGDRIPFDTDIPVEEGWNLIAYYPEYQLDASAPDFYVLSPIIDNVLIAKDINGNFMLPEFDFSNMPSWRLTQGYQVRVDEDVVLNYPEELEQIRGIGCLQQESGVRCPHLTQNTPPLPPLET